jgi:hypothetical protein
MGVLKLDDIDPDGVHIVVDWGALQVGSSFFIPCINTTAAKKQVKVVFGRRDWAMRSCIGAENGVWGIRVWRVA